LKLTQKDYRQRVHFLRKVGIAPKVDLTRKLTPSQKGRVTKAFNPVSSQLIPFQQGRVIDFTETTDKEILDTARRIWGESNVTEKGFFVPRGVRLPANKRFVSVSIQKDKRGNKSIRRRVGRTIEIYHPPPKGLTEKELNAFFKKVQLPKGSKNPRYGFLIDKTLSKSFSSYSAFIDRMNVYVTAIKGGAKLKITGAITMNLE